MNELKKLIPAYLQATKVIVGFCMYAIPASDLQNGRKKNKRIRLEKSIINTNKEIKMIIRKKNDNK